jgi:hypothetical protein
MVLVATDDLINRHSCVSLTIETEWYYLSNYKNPICENKSDFFIYFLITCPTVVSGYALQSFSRRLLKNLK